MRLCNRNPVIPVRGSSHWRDWIWPMLLALGLGAIGSLGHVFGAEPPRVPGAPAFPPPQANAITFTFGFDGLKWGIVPVCPPGTQAAWDPGSKTVPRLVSVTGGVFRFTLYELVPADGPGPDPKPDPKPKPDPQPIPTRLCAIIVEESRDRTPPQAIVLASPKVRALFAEGDFRLIDPYDTDGKIKDMIPADLKPYVDRVGQAKLKLPVLFLVDGKGTVYFEGNLPSDITAMEALVGKFKPKGGAK